MCQPLTAEGEFTLIKEQLEEALARSEFAFSYNTPTADSDLYAMLVDAASRQQDLEALRQYAPLAEETATQCDHVLYQAIAHRAWGVAHRLAGENREAETRLEQALALFDELDTRWQMGRTLVEQAELALARDDPAIARDLFSRALTAFEELGAIPDAARTRTVLESLP